MTRKALMLALAGSAALVAGAFAVAPPSAPATAPAKGVTAPAAATTRVYYFHGNYRCRTCRTIEAYAHAAIANAFAEDLKTQRLDWQVVNVDQPAQKHFVKDFRLYTRSLVVVDARDPKRFKVLEKVWELVGDKPAFQRYVEQEIRGFGRS